MMRQGILFKNRLVQLNKEYQKLITRKNIPLFSHNGIYERYQFPVLEYSHVPLIWRYDLNPDTNPYLLERIGINATFNAGAIKFKGKYILAVRIEGNDRKSFFAIAESPNGIDQFVFWDNPILIPDIDPHETNIYDMRLTAHEDGWVYGIFCSEKKDSAARPNDLSAAIAGAGIVRTKDLIHWERLQNLESRSQQRNVVLHPEFINGKYALYTRPQDGFIETGSGGGIGWTLVDDITRARVLDEKIINFRYYHTIKEVKNGEGPHPIKTPQGWLHLAHGVRNCASGLRYVLYMYMTDLHDPSRLIAEPAGFFMAPVGEERFGDVPNVLFSNGWIADEDGKVFIYYASSDSRLHVATSTVSQLVDYCLHSPSDGMRSFTAVKSIHQLIAKNLEYLPKKSKVTKKLTTKLNLYVL